tara:strand:+ start:3607 stop:4200 length:594 start_codon:yes stop_codon:yes gene_type:complete
MNSRRLKITADDVLPVAAYTPIRKDRRIAINKIKRDRRVEVGPFISFYFENFDTMLHQVHEMLYAERGGEEQLVEELAAYNPLIPQGRELVATMMIEIDDPTRRDRELIRLGYIDTSITLTVADETVQALPGQDQERTNTEGRVSTVHFLRFPFTDEQAEAFKAQEATVILGIGHVHYAHMARLPEPVRTALAEDLS